MALVVYGVMRTADCPGGLSVQWRGETFEVHAVSREGCCALVGDAPDGPVQVRRDALLAHNEVLHAAMERGPVLPLRFGVILDDEDAVRQELLGSSAPALAARLDALKGTAGLQVEVTFDSDRVLSSILETERPPAGIAGPAPAPPARAGPLRPLFPRGL